MKRFLASCIINLPSLHFSYAVSLLLIAKSEIAMAVEKSVEDLEKEITCAICHDHYTEPKVLSCLHYYCKQCVHRLTLRTGLDKPFSCPECLLSHKAMWMSFQQLSLSIA